MTAAFNLNVIMAQLPGYVYWVDLKNTILGCNLRQAEKMGLKSSDQAIGHNVLDFLTKQDAQTTLDLNNKVMATGVPLTVEEPHSLDKTQNKVFLSQKVPLHDAQNKIIGLLNVSTDITNTKQSNIVLNEEKQPTHQNPRKALALMVKEVTGHMLAPDLSEVEYAQYMRDYLEGVIAAMPGNIYWKDTQGKILGGNDNTLKYFGLSSYEDLIGKTDYDLIDKILADKVHQIDQAVIESGVTQCIEEESVDAPKTIYLSYKVPLKNHQGKIIGIVGISFDITERKQMEEQLRVAELNDKKQEEHIRTMRIFAGGIAHELRTPLASMVNAASGIVKFMPRLVESYNMAKEANLDVPLIRKEHLEILKDTAEHIVQGGEYSQTVITAMLVTAQTAAIDTMKFKNLFMVATILTALTTFYYPNPDDKALVHFNAENDFQFWGDETYMMDVIYNLVKNALFFIHQAQKGEITIWLENQKDKNIVYVKDTSIGIPKKNLPRLFEGYFTTREAGTGVGLPLVRRLMQSFGGDITCESVEGEYTTFKMEFPIISV